MDKLRNYEKKSCTFEEMAESALEMLNDAKKRPVAESYQVQGFSSLLGVSANNCALCNHPSPDLNGDGICDLCEEEGEL